MFKQEYIKKWLLKNKFFVLIFLVSFILHFLGAIDKNTFGYDQVDNAWAAKNLLVNHQFPIVGMVAKANSGIYIGPIYYYIVTFFYWIFNLNPIASGAIGLISSSISFWTIYFIFNKIFSEKIALVALILNSFSFSTLAYLDGVQWPPQLIPAISLVIFYLLYRIISGDVKSIIYLSIAVGFSFHLHFTAIFFPIIILLSLPFFPRSKKAFKYILMSIPIFLIFLIPNIYFAIANNGYTSNAQGYFGTYFIGFHLQRMFQITGDALIQFDPYLIFDKLKQAKILILPVFLTLFYLKEKREKRKIIYLIFLWFVVPWVVFATYGGEISDYYFYINRYIALFAISYLFVFAWSLKHVLAKVFVVILLISYSYFGIASYLPYRDPGNLAEKEIEVKKAVNESRRIEFQQGVSESYLYYYYMRQKGVEVYVSKVK